MARSASRAVHLDLPEAVVSAVVEFVTGVLLENPQRVGKSLQPPLDGKWSAGTRRRDSHVRGITRIPEPDDDLHGAGASAMDSICC